MPISIPAFDQYQQPLIPLRGLWNHAPQEGDQMVSAEIDWLVTTKSQAVQFSLSGNSPVSMSQIVALGVDNSRSGADVAFIFPDSGSQLVVPAHNQLIAPVFTNALMFYASSPAAIVGDIVSFQIFNSMPPPVPIAPSVAQNHSGVLGVSIINGTTAIVPAGVNGTLNSLAISLDSTAAGVFSLFLNDGTGKTLWQASPQFSAGGQFFPYSVTNLSVRFINGINIVVGSAPTNIGLIQANVYYSTP